MVKLKYLISCLCCFLALICSNLYAITPEILEQLKTHNIVDTTQTLTNDQIQSLQQRNDQLYKETNVDFKILMIPSIHGESIEQYALDVFNTIKIGNEKLDNGLLLVVAKDDRKMRFEVGYGLEGEFTDVEAGRIIRHTLAPHFKNNDYFSGFNETQKKILDLSIALDSSQNNDQKIFLSLKILAAIFLSFLLCLPLYWVFTKTIINFGTAGSLGAFTALLVFGIFIHIFAFTYLYYAKLAFFLCAFIPLYAPFMLAIFLPFDEKYRLLKIILYSLPLQIYSFFGFGIFYLIELYPNESFFTLMLLTVCFTVILFRYFLFLYRFKKSTENIYLSSFYKQHLKEKAKQKMIDERYERLEKLKRYNQNGVSDNSSNSTSSWSSNHQSSSSNSHSSSSSSNSSSSSSSRDSGGSSGGGGASGSW
ncbi:MAG: TPM domain-containing protein [Candidatus Acinetobacter avistercoris]|uniref:TPM domain-containing protein n=1 Tax=Acinetobacter sp. KS-LM10 TaxID=3120518 RepID=UPI001F933E23|nr:TPM domain-containing protein [Candidatus Acinetobacter avistercoris]